MSGGRSKGFPGVAEVVSDPKEQFRQHAQAINRLNQGKFNGTGTVTLTPSATSTTLTDPRIGSDSAILFMPTTANAATALANIYVDGRKAGEATIHHASSANTDQTFTYLIVC
jgi:hypothetical protein